jgi:hypothetical protein
MPHEYLSEDQIARYGRFPDELSVADLEQCFRLTPDALALALRGCGPSKPERGNGLAFPQVRR